MSGPVVPTDIVAFLACFHQCFTQPSRFYFQQFVLTFCLVTGRRTVTAVCRFADCTRHFTNFHRFLSQYRWSVVTVSQVLVRIVLERLGAQPTETGQLWLPAALDDTLTRKSGRTMEGASWQYDGAAPNKRAPFAFGHCWVVLGLLWAWRGGWLFLAWSARLFFPPKAPAAEQHETKLCLAVRLLQDLRLPGWLRLWVVADGAYAKKPLVSGICALGHHVISRLRSDAVLYEPPELPQQKRRGRPRKYGTKRKMTYFLARTAELPAQTLRLYGRDWRLRIGAFSLVSRAFGCPVLLVVVQPVDRRGKPLFLFTTDLTLCAQRVVELYAARFSIELAFRDLKQHFGMGDYQAQIALAAQRHVILSLVAYTWSQLALLAGVYRPFAEPWRAAPSVLTTGQLRYQLRKDTQAQKIIEILKRQRIPAKIRANVYTELTRQPLYC